MTKENLFTGSLVKLTTAEPGDAEAFAKWSTDPIYMQRAYSGPAYPVPKSQYEDWDKSFSCNAGEEYQFRLRTVEDNRLIGKASLYGISWTDRKATLAIAIGDETDRGKGYGSEAIRLLLRYGFEELNLNRVSLWVFEYNRRAMRLYEKLGFKHEGRLRQDSFHQGRYWDNVQMAMLREEWEPLSSSSLVSSQCCGCDPAKGEACSNCPPIKTRDYIYPQCGCDPEHNTKCLYHYLGLDTSPNSFVNGAGYRQRCPLCFSPLNPSTVHFCSVK
jgi:RimJ/RimL family protein N-acetyltransferase